MSNVSLATFHDMESARRLQERLQQAGIPAMMRDESRIQRFWFMSAPLAAIHVEVAQAHYLEARRRMKEWDMADGILRSAVRCPECQSSRVEFPQLTRKFITPGFAALLMALGILPRNFYCLDCQYTWPTMTRLERKRDVFGWPADSRLWHPESGRRRHP